MIPEKELFSTNLGECFINSLANLLLLKYGDRQAGIEVIERSEEHPLVFEEGHTKKGVIDLTTPEIVLDLTGGKYSAKLFSIDPTIKDREIISRYGLDLADKILDSSRRGVDLEIVSEFPKNREFEFPHILIGKDAPGDRFGHVVVRVNGGLHVNDGRYIEKETDFFGYLVGVLEVEKNDC
jgi:hypothetical protein